MEAGEKMGRLAGRRERLVGRGGRMERGAQGYGGRGARCLGPASQDLTSSAGGGAAWDAGCWVTASLRGHSFPFPLRCSFPTQASDSVHFRSQSQKQYHPVRSSGSVGRTSAVPVSLEGSPAPKPGLASVPPPCGSIPPMPSLWAPIQPLLEPGQVP